METAFEGPSPRREDLRARGIVPVGLNFQQEAALVEEVVKLSTWNIAPFYVVVTDAKGELTGLLLEEGRELTPEEVGEFFRKKALSYPVAVRSLRATGVRLA